ncbi:MAG TPA: aldose epimerase family protein [Verrucomicrobiae bacterium]|nr:aldose epimerase family protein [Verrucomicrobiae bacterium]
MNKNQLVRVITAALLPVITAGLTGCQSMNTASKGSITKADFGKTPQGAPVELYTLRNGKGMQATIMTYGGIVTSLKVPDKNGNLGDVVLGFDNLDGYVNDAYQKSMPYFGALIGRYGNRIAGGEFKLDGVAYHLPQNNGTNTLHGGPLGFDKRVWTVEEAEVGKHGPKLELKYVSKNGEEGFPGDLTVHATYTVTEDNALELKFKATTDKDTVCNLTHHSYFNLRGSGDILDHVVQINADRFTPVDAGLIPTGELRPVAGTPVDFRQPTAIGARINETNYDQIRLANGYDHNFVLNKKKPGELSLAARVTEPTSGRVLEVFATAPGVQFYSGNFLDGTLVGKGGQAYQFRDGFCFEPQGFPDSPNHPNFPTTELKPGQTYHSTIIYKFSVQ